MSSGKSRVYVVEARKAADVQYWAAATPAEDAARAVQQHVGSEWRAKLTERVLGSDYVELLNVPPGRVRRIKHMV